MEPILEVRDLVKEYPGHRALAGISLSIPQGSFFSLLGPSGCGKTTTLRLVAGFEEPTSGEVRIKGEVVNSRKPYERNVSTVFQSYALFPHLTARGNVEFGLKRHGANDIAKRVEEAIKLVGLLGKEVAPSRPTFRRRAPARSIGAFPGACARCPALGRTAGSARSQTAQTNAH